MASTMTAVMTPLRPKPSATVANSWSEIGTWPVMRTRAPVAASRWRSRIACWTKLIGFAPGSSAA